MTNYEALPNLNTSKSNSFYIVDDDINVLGSVNLDSAIKALARNTKENVAERYK